MIKPNCPTPHSSPALPLSSSAGELANRADGGSNCFVLCFVPSSLDKQTDRKHWEFPSRPAFAHAVNQARGGSHLGSRRETRLPQHRPDHHVPRWETHTVLRRKQHSTEPRPA